MPSIVDESGIGVDVAGAIDMTDEQISRTVDLMIVRFRLRGAKFKDIGKILNRPLSTVHARFHAMPQNVREHYASVTLG